MPPKEPWKGQMRIHLFRCPEIYIEQGSLPHLPPNHHRCSGVDARVPRRWTLRRADLRRPALFRSHRRVVGVGWIGR